MNENKTSTTEATKDSNTEILSPSETTNISTSVDITLENKKNNIKKYIIPISCIILVVCAIVFGGFKFKQYRTDKTAAGKVIAMINDIGEITVSDDFENQLKSISEAYTSLTEKQQTYVTNYEAFTKTQDTFLAQKSKNANMKIRVRSRKNAGELCQSFFSDYSGVWYNAIYEKSDEYNKGDFSDFNNALLSFQLSDTYTEGIDILKNFNTTITDTWSKLKDQLSGDDDKETYKVLKDLYAAYKPMYDMATTPKGSYNSYTSETQQLESTYNGAYAAMLSEIPSFENIAE